MPLRTTPFTMRTTASEVLAGVDLTGKRMIVTGGASGLGTETVRALAQAGAEVVIATRNPADAKPILEEFPKTHSAALDLRSSGAPMTRWPPTRSRRPLTPCLPSVSAAAGPMTASWPLLRARLDPHQSAAPYQPRRDARVRRH